MINFDKIEIIKNIGSGFFGTAYLVKYDGKEYAMKVMKVLAEDKIENYVNEVWREIDTYRYIDTLKKSDQLFFTKLYGYHIYDNCPDKVIIKIENEAHGMHNKLKALSESKLCAKLLIEYKGPDSLKTFDFESLSEKQIASIMLQSYKIIFILAEGGYSHSDMRSHNLMINPTKKKTFLFMGKKIPYHGYQLSAIDYGGSAHKKYYFSPTDKRSLLIEDPKFWIYYECIRLTHYSITKSYGKNCLSFGKKYNQFLITSDQGIENFLNFMLKNYREFYVEKLKNYMKLFPKAEKIGNMIINHSKVDKDVDIYGRKKDSLYFWVINSKINIEFKLRYPEVYKNFFKLCTTDYFLLSNEIVEKVLSINNVEDLVKLFIDIIYNE